MVADKRRHQKSLSLTIPMLAVAILWSGAADAQSSPLPNDLVFTGRASSNWDAPPELALVDAATLNVIPLYRGETAIDLMAVSWSPQGDKLAFLRINPALENGPYGYPTEICIVTIDGDLETCFQDHPPTWYAEAPFLIDYQYKVTWSADGQKVYFVAEDQEQTTRRLIEADVRTGETLRTIFETEAYNADWIPTIMSWTPNLELLAVGVGLTERTGFLVNLRTNEVHDLSNIVQSWGGGLVQDQPPETGFVCQGFSPYGTYLAAINTYDNHLIIFDTEQNRVAEVFSPVADSVITGCPTWSEDEETFYFLVDIDFEPLKRLFSFSMQDSNLTVVADGLVYRPLVFSPDLTHIAFTEQHEGLATYRIGIWYPDGTIHYLDTSYLRTQYPVWRPTIER